VEDAVRSWLKDHVSLHRRGAFAGHTRSRCDRVLLPFMESMRLEDVTAGTLFAYRNHVAGLTWGTDSRKARRPKKGRRAKGARISVRAQAQDVQGGKLVIKQSRSGKVRRVPLPPDLLAECQGRVGRLIRFKDACTFNKRVRVLSAIERFHSHLCRHTFATEWREAGGSLAALQAVLGHGSITVTERYGAIGDDLVEREAQRLVEFRAQVGVR
jgi:integrase-like protein